jgi:hypothetical protein
MRIQGEATFIRIHLEEGTGELHGIVESGVWAAYESIWAYYCGAVIRH